MKNTHKFGAAGALALAAAAFAQPAIFTDLGNHLTQQTFTQAVTLTSSTDIQWFRIGLPANSSADGWVDIWTNNSGSPAMLDTEVGVYDSAGNLVRSDDDGDDGLYSLLSFGQNAPARPAHGNGAARTGQSGTLAGGTYWIAVGRFNVNYNASGWSVNSTYAGSERTTQLNFEIQPPGSPIPPTGVLTFAPNAAEVGDVFTASCTVTPGANPVSTGITVRLDASSIGRGSSITMLDDGVPPDNFAGDNIFTTNVTVGNVATGTYALTATVRDAQNRQTTPSANFNVIPPPPANDNCADAEAIVGNTVSADNSTATLDGPTNCGFNTGKDLWYTYSVPADGDYIIETCGGAAFDTVLSAFDVCGGNVLACNDDNCGLQSRIQVNGLVNGQNIVIRLASYNNNPGGPFTINISALGPTNPTGVGAVSPNPSAPGDIVQMRVTVTPGLRPNSTGLAVTGDLSSLGGVSNATFYDDGTNGDDAAGDNVFSRLVTIPSDFSLSTYSVPFNITDDQSRSGSGAINGSVTVPAQWTESTNGGADAGDVPGTAQVPAGSGPLTSIQGDLGGGDSADMYKINICDTGSFSATTSHAVTGTQDTQLFLFDANGSGVQMNDDAVGLQSAFQNQFVSSPGTYYIAVSHYDNDPMNASGQEIWADTPFTGVRAPDGPGVTDFVVTSWSGANTTAFTYRLSLTGTCFAGCAADFNADGVVDFFDYLDFVQAFAGNDPTADFNHDTVIDFFDYLDFVQAFAAGC